MNASPTGTPAPSSYDPPWLALPREVSDVLRPMMPGIVEAIIDAVPQLVPAYARPIEGRFGRGLRRGVAAALDRFLQLPGTRLPALSEESRQLVAGLGSGEFRQGRSMDALLSAYRMGARVTFREMSRVSVEHHLGQTVVVDLGESILAYIDELSAVSAEAYAFEQSERAGAVDRRRTELLDAFWFTAKESTLGYLVGTVVAMAVASLFVLSSALERAVMPIALALRSVPIVALIPLLAYIFGRGAMGSMVIITIIVWFPTLVLVTSGLRSVSAQSIDLMAAYDASPLTTLWKVRMPSAVPALFASAKIGVPLAVLGSLLNGWLSSGTGLGSLMVLSTTSSQYSRLWAAVALVTVSSVLVVAVIDAFESIAVGRYAPDRAAR